MKIIFCFSLFIFLSFSVFSESGEYKRYILESKCYLCGIVNDFYKNAISREAMRKYLDNQSVYFIDCANCKKCTKHEVLSFYYDPSIE